MAACWYWWLLLCSLAAWGNAAPVDGGRSPEKAAGANAEDFSSDHTQLKDLTPGASDPGITSVENKSPEVVQSSLQNSQQGSDKAKDENPSINKKGSQPNAIESIKPLEGIDKPQGGQIGISDTSSFPKTKPKESEQEEDGSIKSQDIKSGLSVQESSSKVDPVQFKEVQKDDPEGTNAVVKGSEQSQDPSAKDQNPQSGLSAQQSGTAELDPAKATNALADIDKSEGAQKDTSGASSLPKPKTKEPKPGEDPSIKGPNTQSGVSAQESSKLNPVQDGNTQEKKDHPEESKSGVSHPALNSKESEQSLSLQTKDQNPQSVLPAQEAASGKMDSSEATNAQGDIRDKSFIPKPETKDDPKEQGDDPLIKGLNTQPGASAQGSSKLEPALAKNEESKTDISEPDFSDLDTNDESKQVEDQDLPSDQSVQHSQKLNPVESPKNEEEVVDPGDEQEKGLGDEKKKSAKHEEDSEGIPRNGSENSHFFAYLVTTAIIVAALYIAYHNKRKIIAFALEGKKSKIARRPKSSDYQRLDQKI